MVILVHQMPIVPTKLEVSNVNVKLDTLEMVSFVLVSLQCTSTHIYFHIPFRRIDFLESDIVRAGVLFD